MIPIYEVLVVCLFIALWIGVCLGVYRLSTRNLLILVASVSLLQVIVATLNKEIR